MERTYVKRYRMEIELPRCPLARSALPTGYRFCAWEEGLSESHARAQYRAFAQEMDAFVFASLGDLDGCRGLMQRLSESAEFLPEATWLLVYAPVGSCRVEDCGTIQGLRAGSRGGSLQNVGIAPEHRGRGLGSQLIRRALAGFQSVGIDRVSLEVTARNQAALRLYHRLGFRRRRAVYKVVQVCEAGLPG